MVVEVERGECMHAINKYVVGQIPSAGTEASHNKAYNAIKLNSLACYMPLASCVRWLRGVRPSEAQHPKTISLCSRRIGSSSPPTRTLVTAQVGIIVPQAKHVQ